MMFLIFFIVAKVPVGGSHDSNGHSYVVDKKPPNIGSNPHSNDDKKSDAVKDHLDETMREEIDGEELADLHMEKNEQGHVKMEFRSKGHANRFVLSDSRQATLADISIKLLGMDDKEVDAVRGQLKVRHKICSAYQISKQC